ncbi:MAG: hypothetical protein PUC85_04090 [bacterium]|nr:hypothetical protein [bacterium]
MIKEGAIHDYLTRLYGEDHGRALSLRKLTDEEYEGLIQEMRRKVHNLKSPEQLRREATRKRIVHQILATFSRIGIEAKGSDYGVVNEHIRKLPISKGRIIPQFTLDELPRLLGAVRAYCDNIHKRQIKEQRQALAN